MPDVGLFRLRCAGSEPCFASSCDNTKERAGCRAASCDPASGAYAAEVADADDRLTAQERAARVRALQEGMKKPDEAAASAPAEAVETAIPAEEAAPVADSVQESPEAAPEEAARAS